MIATTARSRVVRQPEPTPQAQDDPKWFLVAQGSPMPRCRFWSDYATRKQGCAGAKPIPGDNGLSSSDPLQLVRKQLNYSKLTLMGRDARVRAGRPRPAFFPGIRFPMPKSRTAGCGRGRPPYESCRLVLGTKVRGMRRGAQPNSAVRRLLWRALVRAVSGLRVPDVVEIGLSHGSGSTADGRAGARLDPAHRAPHDGSAGCQPAPQKQRSRSQRRGLSSGSRGARWVVREQAPGRVPAWQTESPLHEEVVAATIRGSGAHPELESRQGAKSRRRHECRRGTHECARHVGYLSSQRP